MGYMYALSWKLLIIGLLSEYFANLFKRLYLKKIAGNIPYFFTDCTFSYGKVKDFFGGIRITFHLGRRRGRVMGRSPKWGFFFFAKIPLLSKIQALSHKLLIRQTANPHHCNWHAQKPISKDFQVLLNSSSWTKTTLCINTCKCLILFDIIYIYMTQWSNFLNKQNKFLL